ncbi:MAG: copper resistance protein B [Acinetobacter sp.]
MRAINLFSQSVLAGSMLLASALAIAQEGHQMMQHSGMLMPADAGQAAEAENAKAAEHVAHHPAPAAVLTADAAPVSHGTHDHRKEHGAQIYAVSTIDSKWQRNEDGEGALKSELETRIGTDENKLFIKAHISRHESHDAEYDVKALYSRNIADFWDAQAGLRYRHEKLELNPNAADAEEKLDAVFGLHGMAQYFFETDAYLYLGADDFAAFSLKTERDLLLTQKLMLQPYLEAEAVLHDDSKYAKKTGLSSASLGLETRYEISKKFMPYIGIAYEYSKGNAQTAWQQASGSEQGWIYGAGVRIKF